MRPSHLKSAAILSADKPHGTRVKYMGGCKCMLCRAANSRYQTEREAAKKAGDWNGIVEAKRARRHLQRLSLQGVGRRAVADACDVGLTILSEIRTGKRLRIRRRTERAILGVTADAVSGGALVDADPTWKQINKLLEEGFTRAEIARRLGLDSPRIQFNRFEVTARTKMRVDRFYRTIMAEADK
jgi:transcriptional regulator with XRE-family HTH domain